MWRIAALLAACATFSARAESPVAPSPAVAAPGGGLLGVRPGPPSPPTINVMGEYFVTATRTPQPPERVAASTYVFDQASLQNTPVVTLDEALRSAPSFSLFRRTDSLIANPTAQGVSLRGLGPSGASRSLVLLDGIPLNDPFGGWVAWSQVPRDAVARVEVVPGGGATAWGDAALGGAIQVFLLPVRTEAVVVDGAPAPVAWGSVGTARVSAMAGDFSTRSAGVTLTRPAGSGVLQIAAEDFSTNGFALIAPERRGPIDVAAWSRHRSLIGRWQQPLGAHTQVTATVRSFEEFRGNGTPYQRNGTREKSASVDVVGQPSNTFTWTALGYAQDQSFASTFSSINAARTAETPASDQFAVPATAFGAALTGVWSHADGAKTTGGIDVRAVDGETRENYSFTAGAFTRQRIAGGRQAIGGGFVLHEQPLAAQLHATFGLRIDRWNESDGHRREADRNTGALLRDDHYADRNGTEFSPSAGLVWTPARDWRIRANAQRSFRRPTLNELYRPFRQGTNVTEANAALTTERANSAEVGVERTFMRSRQQTTPSPQSPVSTRPETERFLTLGGTVFWNDLRDAVSNVTIARGPGTFPIVGSLPAGGVGRQRLNVDRTRVQGAELSATWWAHPTLSITGSYLYDDATVRRATIAPALVGNRLAEVPRQTGSLSATWHAPLHFTLAPRLRWIGRQYDDDENTLRLGEVVVADIGLTRPIGKHFEVFLNVENVGNARIETARTADGVVSTGTPRFAFGGIRGTW
jgi:outer membrane receptor protein involved in Fe transport